MPVRDPRPRPLPVCLECPPHAALKHRTAEVYNWYRYLTARATAIAGQGASGIMSEYINGTSFAENLPCP
jgi:hypothetical protein